MSSRTARNVVVIMGGPSAEREVSLVSGRECAAALRGEGYTVTEIDAGPDLVEQLKRADPDAVFNALHGRWGEDGCVQGILEWLRLPYSHSGVMASSVAMDKQKTKEIYRTYQLPFVDSIIADKGDVMAQHVMAPPYVIKPYNEGSSVGVYIVERGAKMPPVLSSDMPQNVMVEAYIPGREFTVTVLGDRALTVTEIITQGWYDYDAKYKEGGSRHVVPADIPSDIFEACMNYAVTAHNALECRGMSRTDFRWDEVRGLEGLFLLETNTQPGMTPTSLSPEQAAATGLSFGALCRWLVEDASCNR